MALGPDGDSVGGCSPSVERETAATNASINKVLTPSEYMSRKHSI